MVFFRKSDVLVAGDAMITTGSRCWISNEVGQPERRRGVSEQMLDITVPKDKQEGGTYVIPAHGRLTERSGDVVEYRDMMTIIRDRIQSAVDKG